MLLVGAGTVGQATAQLAVHGFPRPDVLPPSVDMSVRCPSSSQPELMESPMIEFQIRGGLSGCVAP
jgi:hypothetical protein